MVRFTLRHRGLPALSLAAVLLGPLSAEGTVRFVVDTSDGELFLTNTGVAPAVFDGYSITSASGALLPAAWISVSAAYDASGDQSVDSTVDWFVLGATTTSLGEASPQVSSASLSAGEVVALGAAFNLALSQDLQALVTGGGFTNNALGSYLDLAADFDRDLDVDLDDYGVFAATLGSTNDLRADANRDGVIDAADYTVWRDSPELTAVPPPSLLSLLAPVAAAGLPEPTSGSLAACALLAATRRRSVSSPRRPAPRTAGA